MPTDPLYRLEKLCTDGDWLIVAHNLTAAEAAAALKRRSGNGSRYRIVPN